MAARCGTSTRSAFGQKVPGGGCTTGCRSCLVPSFPAVLGGAGKETPAHRCGLGGNWPPQGARNVPWFMNPLSGPSAAEGAKQRRQSSDPNNRLGASQACMHAWATPTASSAPMPVANLTWHARGPQSLDVAADVRWIFIPSRRKSKSKTSLKYSHPTMADPCLLSGFFLACS